MRNNEKTKWAYIAHTYRNTPILKGPSGHVWSANSIGGVTPDPSQKQVWCIYACGKVPVVRFNNLDEQSKSLLCEETIFHFRHEVTVENWEGRRRFPNGTCQVQRVSALHLNLGGTTPHCSKPLTEVQPSLMWDGDTLRREAGARPWIEDQQLQDPAQFMAELTGLPKACFSSVALAEKVVALVAKKHHYIRFDDMEVNRNGGSHDFSCPIHFTDEPPVGKEYVDWDPFSFHEYGGKYAPADLIIRAARGERVYKKIWDGDWYLRACKKFGTRR